MIGAVNSIPCSHSGKIDSRMVSDLWDKGRTRHICNRCEAVVKTVDNATCKHVDLRSATQGPYLIYRCTDCGKKVKQIFVNEGAMKPNKPLLFKMTPMVDVGTHKPIHMQKGDIRKLPKKNSPLWCEQWSYQGSGKVPYIVSLQNKSGVPIWECSCPAWTQNYPREDCKHILKIKLEEKIPLTEENKFTGMSKETQKEFEKFLKKKAGGMTLPKGAPQPLFKQGRKFR